MEATLRFCDSKKKGETKEYVISSGNGNLFSETYHFADMPDRIEILVEEHPAIIYVARVLLEGLGDPAVETTGEKIVSNLFVNTKTGSKLTVYFSETELQMQREKERDTDPYEYEYFVKFYVFPLEDSNADRYEILRLVEKNQTEEMKKEEALALAQMQYAGALEKQENPSVKELAKAAKQKIKNKLNR